MKRPRKIQTYIDWLDQAIYRETPATVKELLCENDLFGTMTYQGDIVFPFWLDKLHQIHEEDTKFLIVITGAIGTGKTRAAVWAISAVMQRILCLKDPYKYFRLGKGGKFAIAFFNLTQSLSSMRAYSILHQHLLASPWFCQFGTKRHKHGIEYLDIPIFEYLIATPYTKGFGTQGHDVIGAIMDEVDEPSASIKMKERVIDAYDNTVSRFVSRFVHEIYLESLGKFFLVASKQATMSFLDTFITERKNDPNVVIIDIPKWEVTKDRLSGRTFKVSVGDVYTPSLILKTQPEISTAIHEGKKILQVPVEYFNMFDRNIEVAMREVAGIAITASRTSKLFASEKMVNACFDSPEDNNNPVSKQTIPLGLHDEVDLINFIDLTKLKMDPNVPRFIHNDVAYADGGDANGLAMSGIHHWKTINVQRQDGTFVARKVPVVYTDFALRMKAKPGDQIPMPKIVKLVLDLRALGYNIILFTADLNLLSTYTRQALELSGQACDSFSMDKTSEGYMAFKHAVEAGCWGCYWCPMLLFEMLNLEHDHKRNKIDHPAKVVSVTFTDDGNTKETVLVGSKDLADAVGGSVYQTLKYADALPVDGDAMVEILGQVGKKVIDPIQNPHWFLDKDKAFSEVSEQYVLMDGNHQYWHWIKESPQVAPKLSGPFSTPPTKLMPIEVSDVNAFIPPTEVPNQGSPGPTNDFLDVLRQARRNQGN